MTTSCPKCVRTASSAKKRQGEPMSICGALTASLVANTSAVGAGGSDWRPRQCGDGTHCRLVAAAHPSASSRGEGGSWRLLRSRRRQ
eukprot:2450589-Alexandrium_andersonii.AAC.1